MKLYKSMLRRLGLLVFVVTTTPMMYADSPTLTYLGNNGENLGGVYTSPYQGRLITGAGATSVSRDLLMICDSYNEHIAPPTTWTVTAHSFSNLAGAKFSGLADFQHIYNAAAYLGNIILDSAPGQTQQREWASYAIWDLFETNIISGHLSGGDAVGASALRELALANTDSSTTAFSNWTAFTPSPLDQPTGHFVQEMIVRTPEPSAFALLALNMFGVLGLLIVFRRHIVLG